MIRPIYVFSLACSLIACGSSGGETKPSDAPDMADQAPSGAAPITPGAVPEHCSGSPGVCCTAEGDAASSAPTCQSGTWACGAGLIRFLPSDDAKTSCDMPRRPTAQAAGCASAGGICVADAAQCTGPGVGGRLLGDGKQSGGCWYSAASGGRVPGMCCLPPAEQPEGMVCSDLGGICATVGDCVLANAYLTPAELECADGVPFECCVPEAQCGTVDVSCCAVGVTIFRVAMCRRGKLNCDEVPGTELHLMTRDTCQALVPSGSE